MPTINKSRRKKVPPDAGPDVKATKAQPKTWTEEEVALFTKLDEEEKSN